MESIRRRRSVAWKLAALVIVCAGIGIATLVCKNAHHKITDQELLREAVDDWRRSGAPSPGPNPQILEQQAAQGYYDDAVATAYLETRPGELKGYLMQIVQVRAENSDIQGARGMIPKLAGLDVNGGATREIAMVQASKGDFTGALETCGTAVYCNDVLAEFGRHQVTIGDFDGALKTTEQMRGESGSNLYYEVGDALRLRGEQKRVPELAAHMSNRKLAALFEKLVPLTVRDIRDRGDIHIVQVGHAPCDTAMSDAMRGKFAEADVLFEKNKCSGTYVTFSALQQYSVDPAGAERVLRSSPDPKDLISGMAQLAKAAAEKGDVANALLFNDIAQRARGSKSFGPVREIARAWTIKAGPKIVLNWARSQPTSDQRVWALIGMAEALGHAMPQR
jgi:hypothetical protein